MSGSRRDELDETLFPSEPRTLIKHQVYRLYLQCWMGKVLQRFPHAAVVDGFAAAGEYSDGPDGSPLVVARTYLEHSSRSAFNKLHVVTGELRQDRVDHLAGLLTRLPKHRNLDLASPLQGAFAEIVDQLDGRARFQGKGDPVLWILDPFNISSLPFSLVARCLAAPRDEVLVTFFTDEIYRFCEQPHMAAVLTAHYGDESWRLALQVPGERRRKQRLLELYDARLRTLPDVKAHSFSISSKNKTARYSLLFATHNPKGSDCFNTARWRLDRFSGEGVNEFQGEQDDLFSDHPDLSGLRRALLTAAPGARPFATLTSLASDNGYTVPQLRRVLNELREDGLALRVEPIQSGTPWPEDSLVQLYAE